MNTKKVRYQHHHEFLRRCQDQEIIPDGFRLYKTANIGRFSEGFEDNWEGILSGASRAMRDLITREAWIAIESIDRNILELERVVGREFGVQVLDKFVQKITDACGKLTPSLQQRRSKKLSRLELLDQESVLVDNEQSSGVTSLLEQCTSDIIQGPSVSQMDGFVSEIKSDVGRSRTDVRVEDLGPEESLHGVNPLPIDSPVLVMESTDFVRPASLPEGGGVVMGRAASTPIEISRGNITADERPLLEAATASELAGLGSVSDQVYSDGLQVVVNLPHRTLSEAENALLSKGLPFCPTPDEIDVYTLRKDVLNYVRRIRLKEYFYSDEESDGDLSEIPAFRKKSSRCPEKNRDLFLEAYASALEEIFRESNLKKKCHRNLTKEEQKALEDLRSYDDIVIKQADKGSAVVVMDKERYVAEATRQLGDSAVYVSLDPTGFIIEKVNEKLNKAYSDGHISDKTLEYLLVNGGARVGRFYLLPKLHKRGCPGSQVISGCNTPTEKISAFVDHHLKPLVAAVPSYVKDTNDFLKKLRDISTLRSGAIMVTIDVVGLYPHISHDEGLQSIREALNNRENPEIPTRTIVDLAELLLRNNNFQFNENHYLQTLGTAIGTKMAPS